MTLRISADSFAKWEHHKMQVEERLKNYKKIREEFLPIIERLLTPLVKKYDPDRQMASVHLDLMFYWSSLDIQLSCFNFEKVPAKKFIDALRQLADSTGREVVELKFSAFYGKLPVLSCYLVPRGKPKDDPMTVYVRVFDGLAECELEYVEEKAYKIVSACID